ncbi:MAG: 30S ribosomal protein S4 [Nitrospiria bacterium]
MSRYLGPRVKKMRALGVNLPGLSRKSTERRPYAPGEHGQSRRMRISDYGRQLKEKQKLVFNYGMGERQFRRYVKEARASKQATGKKLLELLERRLDNVVFRAGLAPTIPAARQLINHGHIMLNDRRVKTPSIRVRAGDVVQPREKSRDLLVMKDALSKFSSERPFWMEFEEPNLKTTVKDLPDANTVPFEVDVTQVVEYYSNRL